MLMSYTKGSFPTGRILYLFFIWWVQYLLIDNFLFFNLEILYLSKFNFKIQMIDYVPTVFDNYACAIKAESK